MFKSFFCFAVLLAAVARGAVTIPWANVTGKPTNLGASTLFANGAPSGGNDGDIYIRLDSPFGTYKKVSGSWVLQATWPLTTDSRLSDQRVPTDGSVTATKIAAALKPSGSAATTDEALRALGTGPNNAAAGNDTRILAVANKAAALTVGALSSNALALSAKEWPVKTVTWSTNQVLTYTGGSNVAGDGEVILANVTSPITVTVTPTSSTVYRNGANSALVSAINVPVGTQRFILWTPNTGTTLYLDDTVISAADVPYSVTPTNYTPSSADVAGNLAGIDTKLGTIASASVSDVAYDATTWDGDTTHAPSKNAVRDKIESLSAGTLFTTEMGVLWPTADIGSIPSGWLATGSNGIPSFTAIGSYSMIVKSGGNVAAPTFSPVAGTYGSTQSVTLSTTTPSAAIRYTTNGTDPTRSSGTVYSSAVSVSSTQTLKAIAYRDYWADTAVQSAAYTISAAPTLSSATINTAGTQLTTNWSTSVTRSGSALPTISATGGASTLSYSSGSPGTATVWGLSRTVNSGETVTLSYTQPGNDLEATTGGADVASFSGSAVTNNSTQGSHAITSDATTTNSASTSSVSFTHAQGSLTNGYAVVTFQYYWYDVVTLSAPTYGGSSMTLLGTIATNDNFYIAIYGINLGTSGSGSKTVAATLGTHYDCFTTCQTFSGVSQAGGFTYNSGTVGGGSSPATLSLTSAANSDVCIFAFSSTSAMTGLASNKTEVSTFGSGLSEVSKTSGATGSNTCSWSWSTGTSTSAEAGVVLIAN